MFFAYGYRFHLVTTCFLSIPPCDYLGSVDSSMRILGEGRGVSIPPCDYLNTIDPSMRSREGLARGGAKKSYVFWREGLAHIYASGARV